MSGVRRQNNLDSSRTEPFRTGVPHRLPLPPLLAAPTPSDSSRTLTGSSIRPAARRRLVASPVLTQASEQAPVAIEDPKTCDEGLLSDLRVLARACSRAGRPLAEALCHWNMAVEYESGFCCREAIACFKRFIAPCVRAGYTPGVVAGLSAISACLYCLGEYAEAIKASETALEAVPDAVQIVESTTGGWVSASLAAASLLNTIGLAFVQLVDYEAAAVAYSRALQHSLQVPDQRVEKAICANQAAANALVGDFDKAESCLERHLELASKLTSVRETNLEGTLGFASLAGGAGARVFPETGLGAYATAAPEDRDAVATMGEAGIKKSASRETASVLTQLGSLARVHGDTEGSRQYYQRAYNLALRGGDMSFAAAASCAIGVAQGSLQIGGAVEAASGVVHGVEECGDEELDGEGVECQDSAEPAPGDDCEFGDVAEDAAGRGEEWKQ